MPVVNDCLTSEVVESTDHEYSREIQELPFEKFTSEHGIVTRIVAFL